MLKYFKNTSYYLIVFLSFLLCILLVSIPVIDLCEDPINQELFSDLESETNGEEWNKKNELDEYINSSLKLNQFYKIFYKNHFKKNKNFKVQFLEIDSPPPDLI